MYHQTSKGFTVFNTNNERAGKNDSKFYLHEATLIKEADLSSMTAPQLSVDTVNKSTSNNYIPHLPEIVNPDDNIFSLSEPVEEKGNAKYLLKLYVEEALPNKGGEAFSRAYELKDIKEIVTIPDGVLSENGGLTDDTMTISIDSISALFDIVNTYDKEFKPKPVNETMIENGLPKKFYHQTSKDFTVFNTNSERAGKNDSETPTGKFLNLMIMTL